jgi:hypothetical protein
MNKIEPEDHPKWPEIEAIIESGSEARNQLLVEWTNKTISWKDWLVKMNDCFEDTFNKIKHLVGEEDYIAMFDDSSPRLLDENLDEQWMPLK